MGDVAMTVPVIRAFTEQHPSVKITVVSRPFFKPFFDTIPEVHFFAVDLEKKHKGFFGLLRLFQELRELKVDALADLHNVLRSKILTFFFKVHGLKTATVDKDRKEKEALTRAKNKVFRPLPSMVLQHSQVFRRLGFPINLQNPNFPKLKAFTGEKNQKWIGIAPFAQYESKVYPLDLMQKVIDLLAENPNYKVFLFGGGTKEVELLDKMTEGKTNVVNVAGKTQLPQELKIISNLDVMLSMDSGNAHIAAMLGTKVITLWGATHPYAGFAPFNQSLENCLTSDRNKYPLLPTSVYGNKTVEGYQDAMRSIDPKHVVEQIRLVLL
ncbi:glycosyltransferase family 9 protein [Flavobacterium antarcticum]|uniref:glycosyltransferase family 9 protein n=1 Tax=Flavobacterium antarcticum TaxID=271155 RepID=UPI000A05E3ED|nr:glycosyltransferase family 9 protein [Flavobacterium antarcticum]